LPVGLTVFYRVCCALFYIENDAEIFLVHYTWKVAEKRLKMAFIMNKLARINSREIILEKKIILPKIIVKFRCTLYVYVQYSR
jgi:hypothetical protein